MNNKEKEVKASVNSLVENAEEIGKIVSDSVLSGSKTIRTQVLSTTEDEKNTVKGVVKDTLNAVVGTAETIGGAVTDGLLRNNKIIRESLLIDEESPDTTK